MMQKKRHRHDYDIVPTLGSDTLLFITGFSYHDSYFKIEDYKKLKYYKISKYSLTRAQIYTFGIGRKSDFLFTIKWIWNSNSLYHAKLWAFDHLHNCNGLALNKETCKTCNKTIEPFHFIKSCTTPTQATFPSSFHSIDISYVLYLYHLKLKNPDYSTFNNILIDCKLI